MEVFSAERKAVSGELLCDRAGALAEAAEEEVAHHGAGDADGIDAVVFVKSRVLAADKRVVEIIRNLVERHNHTVLSGKAGIVFSLVVVDHRALIHFVNLREIEQMRPAIIAGSDDRPEQGSDDPDFQQRDQQDMALFVALLGERLCGAARLFAGFGLGHWRGLKHFAGKSDTQSS